MTDAIRVRGARQNNLKGIDVEIPRGLLTVVTGPSGSGKSSLAFDTVYAEGQRRYVESLSTYAKQFLERMPRPAVDWIDGVSPSVAIDQRNTVQSSRSTVGTVTEVWDYLRLLWARVGRTMCPECGEEVRPDTVQSATDALLDLAGARVYITFPLVLSPELTHAAAAINLEAMGYLRVVADGVEWRLDEILPEGAAAADAIAEVGAGDSPVDLAAAGELLVVVDRLVPDRTERERLADSLAAAFADGHGNAVTLVAERGDGGVTRFVRRLPFSESFRCAVHELAFPEPTPLLFSFNHPTGACPMCNGFGATLEYDLDLIVPDPDRSLADGALDPWTKPRYVKERAAVLEHAGVRGIDATRPWKDLPDDFREVMMHGGDGFKGMIPFLRSRERKRYKQYIRVFLRQYQRPHSCTACGGTRLRLEALNVRVAGFTVAEVAELTMAELRDWLKGVDLTPFESKVAEAPLRELLDRVAFLNRVGLGYLTLGRQARTLSGGEMQRIRLAGSLGSHLVDTLYVLDEPTIGLHPRDIDRFMSVLRLLRDRGNTVLVVEHEPAVLRAADRLLELGPGSGELGGELVFSGDWDELLASGTATGSALASAVSGTAPRRSDRREPRRWIRLLGASLHNVQDTDFEVPLDCIAVVTGVSGSGKSTLVHDLLYHAIERFLHGESSAREHLGEDTGAYRAIEGVEGIDDVVLVDQSPIGRTPRSNPVTYIKAFDEIRRLFAAQPAARRMGMTSRHFSYNTEGGRCEACKGAGVEVVEMVFMADVTLPCEVCGGRRYNPEVLDVRYRDLNINDVLDLTVDQAIKFFIRQDRLGQALWQLQRVGLGYLRLGQPATTLSGGEAQRLKIARELARGRSGSHRLYIMDEPTVGLGAGEIQRLVSVMEQLVEAGHSVLVVEHNLDVIARADWVIDVGPEAAAEGGRVVASGPPEKVIEAEASLTGRYLHDWIAGRRGPRREGLPADVAS